MSRPYKPLQPAIINSVIVQLNRCERCGSFDLVDGRCFDCESYYEMCERMAREDAYDYEEADDYEYDEEED